MPKFVDRYQILKEIPTTIDVKALPPNELTKTKMSIKVIQYFFTPTTQTHNQGRRSVFVNGDSLLIGDTSNELAG